ncbi:hypothetical protein EJ06DRAFT_534247 [Trichodelitschia bisporula]|uniref:Uncharacterized protein n=1 Tax=Trichodelitschia bisporula TaxID=703511 RepID=A0A6G1HJU9_9PEZI|nr:hypothetical protein EJ06DRAFT_534247 [Trichodelitschia bisporula]
MAEPPLPGPDGTPKDIADQVQQKTEKFRIELVKCLWDIRKEKLKDEIINIFVNKRITEVTDVLATILRRRVEKVLTYDVMERFMDELDDDFRTKYEEAKNAMLEVLMEAPADALGQMSDEFIDELLYHWSTRQKNLRDKIINSVVNKGIKDLTDMLAAGLRRDVLEVLTDDVMKNFTDKFDEIYRNKLEVAKRVFKTFPEDQIQGLENEVRKHHAIRIVEAWTDKFDEHCPARTALCQRNQLLMTIRGGY